MTEDAPTPRFTLPDTLEAAIAEAKEATAAALNDGYTRLQVELRFPEIALQNQAIAREFADFFSDYGSSLKVIFPDTGAAALARRDWGEVPFQVTDIGSRNTPVEAKVAPEDGLFLLAGLSSVEVEKVEKLCNLAGDRPCVLLIPQLENVSIVGIGYAARQLRERFLSTLQSCYYLQPLEGAAILRRYPSRWQIWLENDTGYSLYQELDEKPMGDRLELLLAAARGENVSEDAEQPKPKQPGLLASLQRFLRALSQ